MRNEPKSERVRALDRGLDLVEHLSQRGQMTLADLRHATGLANPTLFRLLATLQHRGWVRRNIVEGRYELSHSLGQLLGENARAHPLAEYAAPILLSLKSRQAGWPSDLCAVIEAGRVEIVESTRLRGPMAPTRTGLGLRPSMVMSAHGRAILAFSSADVRKRHLERIRQYGRREDLQWIESGKLEDEIALTRDRGFGLREPNYWEPPFDPGPELGAMAVPILSKSGVHGSVSLLWIADDVALDEVLGMDSLEDLRSASVRIGLALEREGIAAPEI